MTEFANYIQTFKKCLGKIVLIAHLVSGFIRIFVYPELFICPHVVNISHIS
jgi:hypothetical protein